MNLTLYCNSLNIKTPLHTQYNQKTLVGGAHFLSPEEQQRCIDNSFCLDNTGKNISSLNYLLGDLTGLYWIWKNTDDEFVGTNQYRRFYDEKQIDSLLPLKEDTLYISNYLVCPFNMWEQYIGSHSDMGIKILSEASRLKRIPITKDMIDRMYSYKLLSPCNMFFGHRSIFDKVCQILFEIVFELYNGTRYALKFIQNGVHTGRSPNDKRLLAFLAERILTILYLHSDHFFDTMKIVPVNYRTV